MHTQNPNRKSGGKNCEEKDRVTADKHTVRCLTRKIQIKTREIPPNTLTKIAKVKCTARTKHC